MHTYFKEGSHTARRKKWSLKGKNYKVQWKEPKDIGT